MKKRILNIFAAAILIGGTSFAISSCRSNSTEETVEHPDVADADLDPVDLEHGANAVSAEQLEEIILNPDDMTPGKAVGALKMLNTQISEATGPKREEIMRKFVDLYGIVLEIHGDNLRTAMNRLKKSSGIDIEAIYADYSTTLKVGDEVGGGDAEDTETPKADITTVNETTDDAETPTETPATTQPEAEPEATISTFGG